MLRFRNFKPPPPVRSHTLLAYTPSHPNTSVRILFFKDVAEIYFVNYYQSKKHKQRYKIKKLPYKAFGKFRIITPRRALGSRVCFLIVQGRWEWIILAVWIAHFLYFYFVTNLRKKNSWRTNAYSWLSPPPIWASTLLAGPPLSPLSMRTLWMTPIPPQNY